MASLDAFYSTQVYRDLRAQLDASFSTDPHQDRLIHAEKRRGLEKLIDQLRAEYLYPNARFAIGYRENGDLSPMYSCPRFETRREALDWIADQGSFAQKLGVVDLSPATEIVGEAA